ncbi:MAG: HAD family hydrolase [Litorimonas sp.]
MRVTIPALETDLVIFDCDGVLVDSEPLSNAVMAEHITRLGWPMDGAESIRLFKGQSMTQVHAALEARLGRKVDPAWLETFRADQAERFRTDLTAIPGVRDLIGRVRDAGLADCVASQGRHSKMAVSLGATGLLPLFEGRIFSAEDVARPKPAPDLFLHAARSMGIDPARCVVIEDSVTGIAAARAAGMGIIAYDVSGELAHEGVPTVAAMSEIGVRA